MKFPITAKGVFHATDPSSSRFALGGILIERDGNADVPILTATATNGRQLMSVAWEDSDERYCRQSTSTLINPKDLAKAIKSLGKKETEVLIDELPVGSTETQIELATKTARIASKIIEGRFPRWRDVVPTKLDVVKVDDKNNQYTKIELDYRFLRNLADAVKELSYPENTGVTLYIPLRGKQTVVATYKALNAKLTACIMPMFVEGDRLKGEDTSELAGDSQLQDVVASEPVAKATKKKGVKAVEVTPPEPTETALNRADFADYDDVIEMLLSDGYDLQEILQSLAEEITAAA